MKVTEAIKKAREKYPELRHTKHTTLTRFSSSNPSACAIGFAVAGVIGLDEMKRIVTHNGSEPIYEKFKEIFHLDPIAVYSVNDVPNRDFEATIKELKRQGL